MSKEEKKPLANESENSTKPLASDKEIIDALALDLVQLAQQAQLVIKYSSFARPIFKDAELLDRMCSEILETFIKKEEEDAESENISSKED